MVEKRYIVGGMPHETQWSERQLVVSHLAKNLARGRIALVLGAGVSFGFNLPGWTELTNRALRIVGIDRTSGMDDQKAASDLYINHFRKNDQEFIKVIRKALYEDFDDSLSALRHNDLLSALSAIIMASRFRRPVPILSFNFDGVLERYLGYHGFRTKVVQKIPTWASGHDVAVHHIHGFLPFPDSQEEGSDFLIFSDIHYDLLDHLPQTKIWKPLNLNILTSHICIFVGLSGDCAHLRKLMSEANEGHLAKNTGDLYWGIRFWAPTEGSKISNETIWHDRGIKNWELKDYNELPSFIFDICEQAFSIRWDID